MNLQATCNGENSKEFPFLCLSKYFELVDPQNEANMCLRCKFCVGNKSLKCAWSTSSNLRKHIMIVGIKSDEKEVEDAETDVDFVEITPILKEGSNAIEFSLPQHQRCAACLLNLIATKDSQKAEEDVLFKKIARSSFAYCQALWNKQRSTIVADSIHEKFQKLLVTPNTTRWNSMYHSVKCLVSVIETFGSAEVDGLMDSLGLQRFRPAQLTFLKECIVPCTFPEYFPPIEAVVLFGEPVRWETALQLIIDTLMTNGNPAHPPVEIAHPHIPVLACNMDLQWMAEAWMPRFGHGAFLLCLENLYKKITGHNLIYTALIGKPSEITYHHAHHMVLAQAKRIGITHHLKHLYAIGDNVYTDVFGANLYNRYLVNRHARDKRSTQVQHSIENLIGANPQDWDQGAESCSSILVETGVYAQGPSSVRLDHSPRDFLPVEEKLRAPKYIVKNVLKAIDLVFKEENFH